MCVCVCANVCELLLLNCRVGSNSVVLLPITMLFNFWCKLGPKAYICTVYMAVRQF